MLMIAEEKINTDFIDHLRKKFANSSIVAMNNDMLTKKLEKISLFNCQIDKKDILIFASTKKYLHNQKKFDKSMLAMIVDKINFMLSFIYINEYKSSVNKINEEIKIAPLREMDQFQKILNNTYHYISHYLKECVVETNGKIIDPEYIFKMRAFAYNTKTRNNFKKIIHKANANIYRKVNIPIKYQHDSDYGNYCKYHYYDWHNDFDKDIFYPLCEVYRTAYVFVKIANKIDKSTTDLFYNHPENLTEETREKVRFFLKFSRNDIPLYLSILFSVYLESKYEDTRRLILKLLSYQSNGSSAKLKKSEIDNYKKYIAEHKIIFAYIDSNIVNLAQKWKNVYHTD